MSSVGDIALNQYRTNALKAAHRICIEWRNALDSRTIGSSDPELIYIFSVLDTVKAVPDEGLATILQEIFNGRNLTVLAPDVHKLNIIRLYCRLRSIGITPNHEDVQLLVEDYAGHLSRTSVSNGLCGAILASISYIRWQPSPAIDRLIAIMFEKLLSALEWDSFGLSLRHEYNAEHIDQNPCLSGNISFESGSAGLRYMLRAISHYLPDPNMILWIENALFCREEKFFNMSTKLYALREFCLDSVEKHHMVEDNWRKNNTHLDLPRVSDYQARSVTLGITAVNRYNQKLDEVILLDRIRSLCQHDISLGTGWGGTWMSASCLTDSGLMRADELLMSIEKIEMTIPARSNNCIGALYLVLRMFIPDLSWQLQDPVYFSDVKLSFMEDVNVGLNMLITRYPNFFNSDVTPAQPEFDFIANALSDHELKIGNLKDKFLADRIRLDEEIFRSRIQRPDVLQIYSNSVFSFMDRLQFCNMDDETFNLGNIKLNTACTIFRSPFEWISTGQYGRAGVKQGTVLYETDESCLLIGFTQTGYLELQILQDFEMVLNFLSNEFAPIADILDQFKNSIEIENDPEVEQYFYTESRKVIVQAILDDVVSFKR